MINIKELRLGNVIQLSDDKSFVRVNLKILLLISQGVIGYNSIELTPEILTLCGFEEKNSNKSYNNYITNNKFVLSYCKKEESLLIGYGHEKGKYYNENICYNAIESLHQLQNCYFFHYGKELEIDLKNS